MSFDALTPPAKPAAATEPVRVGITSHGEAGPSRLYVLLQPGLIDQIHKGATTAAVELGKAEDRHLLRIRLNGKGEFKLTQMPRSGHARDAGASSPVRVLLPSNARWPICKMKPQSADYSIGKGYIDVTLPAWAWDAQAKADAEDRAG